MNNKMKYTMKYQNMNKMKNTWKNTQIKDKISYVKTITKWKVKSIVTIRYEKI